MTPPLNEYRVEIYESVTQRIRRGLERLRKDLTLYARKPTKRDLARLSSVHVNTLDTRSNSAAPDQGGQETAPGWPLSELRQIQRQWKDSRSSNRQANSSVELVSENADAHIDADEPAEQFHLESYKRQNIDLAYRNEELSIEIRELKRVNHNLRMEIDRISAENTRLKSSQMARSRARSRVKVVK